MRWLGIALLLSLLVAPGVGAQQPSRVCETLAVRLAQSPAALQDRLLNEALFEAAALDCAPIATDLLAQGASPVARNRSGGTALTVAAKAGSSDVVDLLLAHDADLDHTNLNGSSVLLVAVEARRRRVARALIDIGADVQRANRQGVTPLMAASFTGDLRMVQALLAAGADPQAIDAQGKGAMVYAAGRGFPSVVEALLAAGVDADRRYGHELTALMWAAGHANDAPATDGIAVAKQLLDADAAIDRQDDRGRTALMIAAERGHQDMVAFLLEQGADKRMMDLAGKTANALAADAAIESLLAP